MLTAYSAKELEHFERIRQTFESVDKQKKDGSADAPQTIAEAMEAFDLGASPSEEMPIITNGKHAPTPAGSTQDRIKGLKKRPGSIVHSASDHARINCKGGKGKGVTGGKGKASRVGPDSDSSFETSRPAGSKVGPDLARKYSEDDDMVDGVVDGEDDEDDYVVRTDYLTNPMEQVE